MLVHGDIWVFPKNWGTPKWMVKIMENPIKVDDLGVPLFSVTPPYATKYMEELPSDTQESEGQML